MLAVLISSNGWCQDLLNQTNLFVPDGVELHIDGDFINEGFVLNQGTLLVSGSWKNTNVYQGLGTVVLNGDVDQDFFNNKNAVNHLTINGPGTKHIIDFVPIASQLDLLTGIVSVTNSDTLAMAEAAVIKGGSVRSHVDGALICAGTGYKFYPIGKDGNYYPVEMLNITGVSPVVSMEVFLGLPAIDAPEDVTVYSKVFWVRKNLRGTYLESPVTLGFDVPDNFTSRHMIEILEGDNLTSPFFKLEGVTVEYNDVQDKVVSESGVTRNVLVIGGSTPADGLPGQFYFSTSLSRYAADPDNRVVKVFGDQLTGENFRFLVFNRWGKVVYENTSLKEMIVTGWDGKAQGDGQYLPSGSYPFVLQGQTSKGEVLEKKGVISIVN